VQLAVGQVHDPEPGVVAPRLGVVVRLAASVVRVRPVVPI
jgi:hypothetical protein